MTYSKNLIYKKLILSTIVLTSNIIASDIKVEVSELLNKNGKLSIGLYNKDDDTFTSMTKYYKGVNLIINNKNIVYTFTNIPNGTYAISVVHDKNKNKKLDKNFFGIPKEGYGFSNNIRPNFRGANFEESKFELNKYKNIIINMVY